MKIQQILFASVLLTLLFSSLLPSAFAQEEDDVRVRGLELEKLISMINGWISLSLFILAFIAYRRDGRKRLLYVGVAFLLFAVKSFLVSLELFGIELIWIDPVSTILEFAVLLSFFYGVLRK
jgi:hypothetical protein